MPEFKMQPERSVKDFLDSIEDLQQRQDSQKLSQLMARVTKQKPVMWGDMVGFGSYHYKYASGHEGDCFIVGFAPRKGKLTIYIMDGFRSYPALLAKIGKHSSAKSCLYIKRLSDIDTGILEKLVKLSHQHLKTTSTPAY